MRFVQIALTEFTIPDLPPPFVFDRCLDNGEPTSSSPMPEPSSQEADKENAPAAVHAEARSEPIQQDDKEGGEDKGKEVASADNATALDKTDDTANVPESKPDDETPVQTQTQTEPVAAPSSQSMERDGKESSGDVKLPIQLATMLNDIKSHIQTFTNAPPHTLQRLAELVLHPRAHYRALATYLHAVDRVVQVTSGLDIYPLPLAIPDMSAMQINGVDPKDPATAVSWHNPTTVLNGTATASNQVAVDSDEALGGALLTPIPWLTRRSPEHVDAVSSSSGAGSTGGASSGGSGGGAQIHSECTETIDGPNGMGSIETVSVSVNGVPSTGHARGVTQGELLRQEQRAGVVPVNQLSRTHPQHPLQLQQLPSPQSASSLSHGSYQDDEEEELPGAADEDGRREGRDEEEEETPHARGPDEIGVGDTGPQSATTSSMGDDGVVEMQGIDIAAAVGRPPEEEEHPEQQQPPQRDQQRTKDDDEGHEDGDGAGKERVAEEATDAEGAPLSPASTTGTKREAEEEAEGEPIKKLKE